MASELVLGRAAGGRSSRRRWRCCSPLHCGQVGVGEQVATRPCNFTSAGEVGLTPTGARGVKRSGYVCRLFRRGMFGHSRRIAGRVYVLPRDDEGVHGGVISAGATNGEPFILGSLITSSICRFIVQDVRSDMVSDKGRGSIICLVTPPGPGIH